ncbi:hypothetical protein HYV44_02205 [Candidatus Microgenomates bacterium]|nr:hypothetical protein [Candidatus Microgenomates bacterium]
MLIWAIVIVLLVYWVWDYQRSKGAKNNTGEIRKGKIEEDNVIKMQTFFEKGFQNTSAPDSLGRKELYIYKNLMRTWYNDLSSKYRYDDAMTQKLRNDWLDYMEALKNRNAYNFMSLESDIKEEQDSYENDQIVASRKVFAIEDAFAKAIGDKAVVELDNARKIDYFSLDENGNPAPEGFSYDLANNLQPNKKAKK